MISLILLGGLVMVLIREMLFCFSVFRVVTVAFRVGMVIVSLVLYLF